MADKIRVFALGGLDEQGKSMTVIEINGDIFILDCGLKFPNKTTPGIDFLIPNTSYIKENKDRVKAYIITHAHDEQIGALPYFYEVAPAPVYTTKISAIVIDKRTIFSNHRIKYNFKIINPTSSFTIAGHQFETYQTVHNAVDSFGVAINTDQGYIVYSGEFIIDYDTRLPNFQFDLVALGKIAKNPTLLLMTESLGANKDGYCSPHHKFTNHIRPYFEESTGRIFVAAYWQNTYSLIEIINLAVQYHKKIVFYDMIAKDIVLGLRREKVFDIPESCLIEYQDVLRYPESDLLFLITGTGDEIFTDIEQLCHRQNEDKRIFLGPKDTFLLCTPPGDNLEDHYTTTVDELFKTKANVVYLKKRDVATMHARADDLRMMLSLLKPKYYLPIRGSFTQMLDNAKLALSMGIGLNHTNVFVLDNGTCLTFDGGPRPSITNPQDIDTTEMLIDGLGVGDVSTNILDERNKLGYGGVVVISSAISKSQHIMITKPDCQMRGFVFVKDAEPLLKLITNIYIEEVAAALKAEDFNNKELCDKIADRVNKAVRHSLKRDPMVVPIVIEME